jgi:hypothetical protein
MTEQRHAALGIHAPDADADPHEQLKRGQIARRTRILTVVVLVLLALGAGRTILSRLANAKSLEAGTAERAKVYVKTALPKTNDAGQTLALPGTLQGFVQSPIAARLPAPLDQGHRQPRRERRGAGRDRDTRDRPAADAGGGRA